MYIIRKKIRPRRPSRMAKRKKIDIVGLTGLFKMHSRNIYSGEDFKKIDERYNVITTACLNRVAMACVAYTFASHYSIKYLAIGDDDTAAAASDTVLGNEVLRTRYVSRANTSSKVAAGDFYITATDYAGDIEELGIFGGTTATDTADSGGMFSHVNWSYTKSSAEELLIEYEVTVS